MQLVLTTLAVGFFSGVIRGFRHYQCTHDWNRYGSFVLDETFWGLTAGLMGAVARNFGLTNAAAREAVIAGLWRLPTAGLRTELAGGSWTDLAERVEWVLAQAFTAASLGLSGLGGPGLAGAARRTAWTGLVFALVRAIIDQNRSCDEIRG